MLASAACSYDNTALRSRVFHHRCLVGKAVADPTFGRNRDVALDPPRYVAIEKFASREYKKGAYHGCGFHEERLSEFEFREVGNNGIIVCKVLNAN